MKKLIALFGLTFIAGTAFANETMEPTVDDSDLEALFVKLDTDANGSVNADEISALPDLADKFSTAGHRSGWWSVQGRICSYLERRRR